MCEQMVSLFMYKDWKCKLKEKKEREIYLFTVQKCRTAVMSHFSQGEMGMDDGPRITPSRG